MLMQARIAKFAFVAMAAAITGCASQTAVSFDTVIPSNNSVESILNAGDRARSAGNLASAETFYEQVTVIDARSIQGWLRLGAVQVLSGQFVAATQSYRAAQALDGSNTEAAFALGQIALSEARFADAAEEVDAGLREHPDDPQLNYAAWIAYTRLGHFQIARQYYRNALTHDSHKLPEEISELGSNKP